MPARRAVRSAPEAAQHPRIAVIAALDAERASLEQGLMPQAADYVGRYQSGPGAVRAARSADLAVADGAAGLISWGFAGALREDLDAGTVLLPTEVCLPRGIDFRVDRLWQRRLLAALEPLYRCESGRLLASNGVLRTSAEKARAAGEARAVAVDMESAAIARAAMQRALPFVVIRVVVDRLGDALPPGIERWLDEGGNRRLLPLAGAALTPRSWPALWRLSHRHRRATAVLTGVARTLAWRDFLHPQSQWPERPTGGA